MFHVVSTGLSSPPPTRPPTATAACLHTCRLQLVRKNAFQITASVSSPQALLPAPPCPPPPPRSSLPHSLTPHSPSA